MSFTLGSVPAFSTSLRVCTYVSPLSFPFASEAGFHVAQASFNLLCMEDGS